jgi:processive 1,2-diacylglycerol beta-glucosyltransferase
MLVQQPSQLEKLKEQAGPYRQQDSSRLAVMHVMNLLSDTYEEKGISSLQKYA